MIRVDKLTKEYSYFIQERFSDSIFGWAPWFGIWFDEKEVKYIETKMKTDKLYKLVGYADSLTKRSLHNRLFECRWVWLSGFLQDKSLPIGVELFIKYYIAHEFGIMQMDDEFDGTHKYEDSVNYELMAQRWMEKCR